jgi:DUF917 family protein
VAPSWRLAAGDVAPLARGARLLGAGGGGDPRLFALLAERALAAVPVTVAAPSSLDPDGLVLASALLGSPSILGELLPSGEEFVRAFRGLERHLDRRAVAVMGLETAGVNVFPPILVAAALGLPLLDLDGMGRAFPRLDHTILHARGVAAGPLAVTGAGGELVIVDVEDAARAERLARVSLAALGGWAGCACFPARVAVARAGGLAGSLRRALALGRAAAGAADAEELAARLGGRLLAQGRVLALRDDGGRRGPRAAALVEPADAPGGTLRLEYQSEYLLAARDGEPIAATPDLLVVVGGHDLVPIACEALRRGDEVAVILLPADPAWHAPAALALAGPAAFGYAAVPSPPPAALAREAASGSAAGQSAA